MYYRHFGLSAPPFQFTPSADSVFLGRTHLECMAALEWALLHESCGFMLLIGETGTGKTTLLCSLVAKHFANIHIACITNPRLPFEDLMRVVLGQLGVPAVEGGKLQLLQAFEKFLDQQPEGHRTAIVVDEAQDLSDDAFEDLRLLANSAPAMDRRLQFALVGQPELLDRLSAQNMRQIRERIGAKAALTPLSPAESAQYVDFRLQAQQGKARNIFARGALEILVNASGGIPRRLNVLSHNALLSAYSEGADKVTPRIAREVVKDYQDMFRNSDDQAARAIAAAGSSPAFQVPYASAALVVASLFLLALGAAFFWVENASGRVLTRRPATMNSVARVAPNRSGAIVPITISKRDEMVSVIRAAASEVPASVPAVKPAPSATRYPTRIQLREGDTLEKVALRYLGSSDRVEELIKVNPQIQDYDYVYAGEVINLPAVQKAAR